MQIGLSDKFNLSRPPDPFYLNHNSILARGLIAWWPMGAPGGTEVFDYAPYKYNIQLNHGSPLWVPEGIKFDGSNDYGVVGGSPFNLTILITVFAWTRPVGDGRIFSHWGPTTPVQQWLLEWTSLKAQFARSNGGGNYRVATDTVVRNANEWYLMVGRYDGSNTQVFVNGQLAATASGTLTAVSTTHDLGAGADSNGDGKWNGTLGHCGIYNRNLSDDEIWRLYDPVTRYELFEPLMKRVWVPGAGAGGQEFTKDLSGVIAAAGVIALVVMKTIAAQVTPSGALAKLVSNVLTGSIATAGTLTRSAFNILVGAIPSGGALLKSALKTSTASVASSSTLNLLNVISRVFSGAIASAATITKQTAKSLAGNTAISGLLQFGGGLSVVLSGSIASVGVLTRSTAKTLSGVITSVGDLIAGKINARAFVGSISPSGTLTATALKAFAGALTLTGIVARYTLKFLSSVIASFGQLLGGSARVSTTLSFSVETKADLTTIDVETRATISEMKAETQASTVNELGG